ncbi:hypothetical protein CPC08DRAFT_730430 [Agrocybe pediades]|nr:hypothetical protein CPC08DRAFT_730430 [Agrocybe pediades]
MDDETVTGNALRSGRIPLLKKTAVEAMRALVPKSRPSKPKSKKKNGEISQSEESGADSNQSDHETPVTSRKKTIVASLSGVLKRKKKNKAVMSDSDSSVNIIEDMPVQKKAKANPTPGTSKSQRATVEDADDEDDEIIEIVKPKPTKQATRTKVKRKDAVNDDEDSEAELTMHGVNLISGHF